MGPGSPVGNSVYIVQDIFAKKFIRHDCVIIWVTPRVSHKMQGLLALREHLRFPLVGFLLFIYLTFSVALFFVCLFVCLFGCLFFFNFVCLRPVYLVFPMLTLSLDCLFLIIPSVFSNTFIHLWIITFTQCLVWFANSSSEIYCQVRINMTWFSPGSRKATTRHNRHENAYSSYA
jgi:hypothetical protein